MSAPAQPTAPTPAPATYIPDVAGLPADATCANCLAPVGGPFCAQCGAPRLDLRPVTTRRFVGDLWNELTSVDSLTVRTLRSLLSRPGELTRDYLAGRTRWYLSPLRVYLLMFAVLLTGQALLPDRDEVYERMQTLLTLKLARQQRDVAAEVARGHRAPTLRQRAMLDIDPAASSARTVAGARFVNESQWVQAINAVIWGALLALLYRRRRRSYAEHVVLALHLLAFNVVLILVNSALRSLVARPPGTSIDAISWLHWLAIGSYTFLAVRRLYGESRPRAAIKSALFVAGAQASMMLISLAAYMYAGVETGRAAAARRHAPAAPPAATTPAPGPVAR